MIEYTRICQRCNKQFNFLRQRKMSPTNPYPKYCPNCRAIILRKQPRGRFVDSGGYVKIFVNGKYLSEHRIIMEQILGRKLRPYENVHHKDGNRSNNNPDNLELWIAPSPFGIKATDLICPHCHKSYS